MGRLGVKQSEVFKMCGLVLIGITAAMNTLFNLIQGLQLKVSDSMEGRDFHVSSNQSHYS